MTLDDNCYLMAKLPANTDKVVTPIGFVAHMDIAFDYSSEKFGAEFAYTIDGGPVGELQYENFNASSAEITIHGKSVHPGHSKNKMVNAMLIAAEFIEEMPKTETPAYTEGYDGFYHLNSMNSSISETYMF